jgi:alpha-beta hydrolase superfamily lysophospholipase
MADFEQRSFINSRGGRITTYRWLSRVKPRLILVASHGYGEHGRFVSLFGWTTHVHSQAPDTVVTLATGTADRPVSS